MGFPILLRDSKIPKDSRSRFLRLPYRSPAFIVGSILLLLFILSFSIYLLRADKQTKRTFFFPEKSLKNKTDTLKLSGENRFLPIRNSMADDIRLLVEDIILGPTLYTHERLVAKDTRLISLLLNQGILYLNFSSALLEPNAQVAFPLAFQIQALGNTVLFNFPGLTKVYVFIEGQIPDFRFLYGDKLYSYSDGVRFRKGVFK